MLMVHDKLGFRRRLGAVTCRVFMPDLARAGPCQLIVHLLPAPHDRPPWEPDADNGEALR